MAKSTPGEAATASGLRWQLHLLGHFRLIGPQQLTRLPTRAVLMLLARLALHPHTQHAREALAEWLWPAIKPRRGRADKPLHDIRLARLRHTLSLLLQQLEPPGMLPGSTLFVSRHELRLNPDAFDVDVWRFKAAVAAGRTADALALYRGELLPGLQDPLVDDWRDALAGLLNRLPDAADAADTVDTVPRTQAAATLVPYVTAFVGREAETAALQAALRQGRWVVVTGPGGCGKTRLAAEACEGLSGFQRVAWVRLAGETRADQIVEAVANAFGLPRIVDGPARSEQLVAALGSEPVLAVLDNFEQLADGGGEAAVASLLRRLTGLRVVVTSRREPRHRRARLLRLAPLPLPAAGATLDDAGRNACVAMFVDRARAVRTEFTLHARNLAAVVRLCRLVEGLPYMVELVAAQLRRRRLSDIAQALLADGLASIERTGPKRRLHEHHVSPRMVAQASIELLDDEARRALTCLAVFRGACTLAQAQLVLAPPLFETGATTLLGELIRDSLLTGRQRSDRVAEFEMLESTRDCVLKSAEPTLVGAARQRHRQCYAHLAAQPGGRALDWQLDAADVEAALADALTAGDGTSTLPMAVWLGRMALARGTGPRTVALLRDALASSAPQAPERAFLAATVPVLMMNGGAADEAAVFARDLLAHAMTPGVEAAARFACAHLSWLGQRSPGAVANEARIALQMAQQHGDIELQARASQLLGSITVIGLRQPVSAEALFRQSDRLFRQVTADPARHLRAMSGLVACLLEQKRYREALALAGPVAADAAALGEVGIQLLMINRMAAAHVALRRFGAAAADCQQQLRVAHPLGLAYHVVYGIWNLCQPLARLGDWERSARLLGFAQAAWLHLGDLSAQDRHYVRHVRRGLNNHLGADRIATLEAEGQAIDSQQAVAIALAAVTPARGRRTPACADLKKDVGETPAKRLPSHRSTWPTPGGGRANGAQREHARSEADR